MSADQEQPDFFDDEFDRPRVFRCVGGAFIGAFNREAATPGSDEAADPVHRLSDFFSSEEAAHVALQTGVWPPPAPE